MTQTFPWYLQEIFINRFAVSKAIALPFRFKKYQLIKVLSDKGFPFATGLYKDKSNSQVVIKFWKGNIKNIYYFNLIHQIEVMQALTQAQARLTSKDHFGFSIPKFISAFYSPTQVVLIMEKVSGEALENISSATKQFAVYENCLKFLSHLSKKLTAKEKQIVTTKSVWDFLLLYPFVWTTAVIVQPKLLGILLRGAPAFFMGIPDLLRLSPDTLVHGDLHPDNILLCGKAKFSLIDVENMRLCYSIYEPISTVSLKGNSKELKKLVIKKYLKPQSGKKAMDSLIVNNATHNLSGDRNPQGIASYKQSLSLAFQI